MKMKHGQADHVIAHVQASMAVEGLKPSMKAQIIGKRYLDGKLSSEEAIAQIKMQHSANFCK